CSRLEEAPDAFGDEPAYLSVARDGTEVVAVTIRTPPYNVLVSTPDPATADAIADDVRARFASLPGGLAPPAASAAFAQASTKRSGQPSGLGMPQRIHGLTAPPDVPPAPGRYREATTDGREVLARWFEEFVIEALPDHPEGPPSDLVDRR